MASEIVPEVENDREAIYRRRTREEAFASLQRFIGGRGVLSIPAQPLTDDDFVIGDVIREWDALRSEKKQST